MAGVAKRSPAERFWACVEKTAACWPWQGRPNAEGYGRLWVDGRLVYAHRFSYELNVAPIPPGLTIDHLCRNRICVNPSHLEPVPARVNQLRGNGAGGRNARKTHCPHGHEYTEENTRRTKLGQRVCRTCRREDYQRRAKVAQAIQDAIAS